MGKRRRRVAVKGQRVLVLLSLGWVDGSVGLLVEHHIAHEVHLAIQHIRRDELVVAEHTLGHAGKRVHAAHIRHPRAAHSPHRAQVTQRGQIAKAVQVEAAHSVEVVEILHASELRHGVLVLEADVPGQKLVLVGHLREQFLVEVDLLDEADD